MALTSIDLTQCEWGRTRRSRTKIHLVDFESDSVLAAISEGNDQSLCSRVTTFERTDPPESLHVVCSNCRTRARSMGAIEAIDDPHQVLGGDSHE